MVFVDTGAWFALSVDSDPDHAAAKEFISQNHDALVTSDYVVDERLTLSTVRRERLKGIEWLRDVFSSLTLLRVESAVFAEAGQVYSHYADKAWSLTDCTSYVIMRRFKIARAFSFDRHFREFGVVHVVP